MRRVIKVFLIIVGVIVLIYGVYFLMGRPAISLPTYHYTVPQGSPLYDLVRSTKSEKVTVILNTRGELKARDGTVDLINLRYTPRSFNNTVLLASEYLLPEDTQNTLAKIYKVVPLTKAVPGIIATFFYHVVRVRLTVEINAN
ncbi:MAG: hypothetical protein VB029_07385 [Anaerolineaceae bacterium]|nr:hypothetical protein [Anaerolineaceae bacterium]HNX45864.1 hypothetical protein [Anaerolineaceae bacterium]HPT24491.1 hypothetical protein [Anaerolineaceae bacterium]